MNTPTNHTLPAHLNQKVQVRDIVMCLNPSKIKIKMEVSIICFIVVGPILAQAPQFSACVSCVSNGKNMTLHLAPGMIHWLLVKLLWVRKRLFKLLRSFMKDRLDEMMSWKSYNFIWVSTQNRGGKPPQIIHFNRVFHYKPSILGYPYFWKHPYRGFVFQHLWALHFLT